MRLLARLPHLSRRTLLAAPLLALLVPFLTGGQDEQDAEAGYRTLSIAEIASSLPDEPIHVGFDVDDTVLFSSPGFYYGMNNVEGADGSNRYGASPLSNPEFWRDANSRLDAFSLPKQAARRAIAMHKKRGDTIFFITARPGSEGEQLSALLARTFEIEDIQPVIFTGLKKKTPFIKQTGLALYYGDSDGDIEDAQAAGIRGIRFLRSPMSTHPRPPHPGKFGEDVLVDSDY